MLKDKVEILSRSKTEIKLCVPRSWTDKEILLCAGEIDTNDDHWNIFPKYNENLTLHIERHDCILHEDKIHVSLIR